MAHRCPDCGMICHCNGDIDDILIDTEDAFIHCIHYLRCQERDHELYFDSDEQEGE